MGISTMLVPLAIRGPEKESCLTMPSVKMSSGQSRHGSSPSASCALSSLGWDSGPQVSWPVGCSHPDIGSFSRRKRRYRSLTCSLGFRLARCRLAVPHLRRIHSGRRYLCHTDEHGHAGSIDAGSSDHRHGARYRGCRDCVVMRLGTLTTASVEDRR